MICYTEQNSTTDTRFSNPIASVKGEALWYVVYFLFQSRENNQSVGLNSVILFVKMINAALKVSLIQTVLKVLTHTVCARWTDVN